MYCECGQCKKCKKREYDKFYKSNLKKENAAARLLEKERVSKLLIKFCKSCNEYKSINDYYKSNKSRDGLQYNCKKCQRIRIKKDKLDNPERYKKVYKEYRQKNEVKIKIRETEWIKNNKSRIRASQRISAFKRYGISKEIYDTMLSKQNNNCGNLMCKSKGETLSIDHNHKCCPNQTSCGKCIRGLLCRKCNSALGFLNDDHEMVLGLAQYIGENKDARL